MRGADAPCQILASSGLPLQLWYTVWGDAWQPRCASGAPPPTNIRPRRTAALLRPVHTSGSPPSALQQAASSATHGCEQNRTPLRRCPHRVLLRPVHIGTTVGAASGRHGAPGWPVHWLCHLVNRHISQDTPRAGDAWDPISAATLRRARRYPWRLPHPSAAEDFYKTRPAARPTLLVMPSISSHTSTG